MNTTIPISCIPACVRLYSLTSHVIRTSANKIFKILKKRNTLKVVKCKKLLIYGYLDGNNLCPSKEDVCCTNEFLYVNKILNNYKTKKEYRKLRKKLERGK